MGILSKLFGQTGKLRFEITDEDGKEYEGTTFFECFNVSREELEDRLGARFYVETGKRPKKVTIVAVSD